MRSIPRILITLGTLLSAAIVVPEVVAVPVASPRAASAADFDGNGVHDLAVGVPDEDVGDTLRVGGVHVIYGTSNGLDGDHPVDDQFWTQDSPGVPGIAQQDDHFGNALAWGDFDGDGLDDLAIGVQYENVTVSGRTFADAGVVQVLYGSGSGLTTRGTQVFAQGVGGLAGTSEAGDRFGAALTAGKFGGSSHDDLAIGDPGEDEGTTTDAGRVQVLLGSPTGLTTVGNRMWHQNVPEIDDVAEAGDQFGASLASANVGRSSHEDLVVGVPYEDIAGFSNAGAIQVIYGSATGLVVTGDQFWHQDGSGIPGVNEAGDAFGSVLETANLGRSAEADVAIGAPREDLGVEDGGAVWVLYGSANGLTSTSAQLWTFDTAGIGPSPSTSDRLGSALAAGDFGNGTPADLAVGVPYDDPANDNAGSVLVVYGSSSGLRVNGYQQWTQDSCTPYPICIEGDTENADHFGAALAAVNYGWSSHDDLAVGVPQESWERTGLNFPNDIGAVNVIYGTPDGLNAIHNQFWWQRGDTLHDAGDNVEHFGAVLE
jgi:hypothetical protein